MKSKIDLFIENSNFETLERFKKMGWEDRTPCEAMANFTELSPNDVIKLMRKLLTPKDYTRWRKRANNQGHLKHLKTRPKEVNRFKCSRERLDGSTKGYK